MPKGKCNKIPKENTTILITRFVSVELSETITCETVIRILNLKASMLDLGRNKYKAHLVLNDVTILTMYTS